MLMRSAYPFKFICFPEYFKIDDERYSNHYFGSDAPPIGADKSSSNARTANREYAITALTICTDLNLGFTGS